MINVNMQASPVQVPQTRFFHLPRFQNNYQKSSNFYVVPQFRQHQQQLQNIEFDGKRLRKAVARKTVDYNSSLIKYLENRIWQRDHRDRRAIQTDIGYYTELTPPLSMIDNPINAVTTKFVRTSTNKMRCPIFCVAWTPEGRRLVTGASSGEFTLWNGLTFNFETILQAHDSPVRCMVWSHNDLWMVTGDHSGYVKYWQSNMNNVKMFQAHKEPLRGISFCPTDAKFATCSDDGTVRIWDFMTCVEERILRGHGADVKCLDWHPQKGLIVSGSKDSQQPIKLWDPKSGQSLATIHAHKSTVMEVKWNSNGNWLLTASRDHLLKLFDIRKMSQEVQTFRGHKKEACSLAWHPVHETLFASGGSDGSLMFWVVGADKEVGGMEQAHDSCVWSLAWHPLGHILCSGSNDHTSKFWTRNRPGDKMGDKYNLNTLPRSQDETAEYDEPAAAAMIPGMGLEHGLPEHLRPPPEPEPDDEALAIPGLDFGSEDPYIEKPQIQRKVPFSKPIPIQFQQQWMENKQPLLLAPPPADEKPPDELTGHPMVPQGLQPPVPGRPPPMLPAEGNFPPGNNAHERGNHPEMNVPQDIDHREMSMVPPIPNPGQDFDDRSHPDFGAGGKPGGEWRPYGNDYGDQDLRLPLDNDLRPKDMDHRNYGGNRMMNQGRERERDHSQWKKMIDRDDRMAFFGQEQDRDDFNPSRDVGNFNKDFDQRGMHGQFSPSVGSSQGAARGRGRGMLRPASPSRMPYQAGPDNGGHFGMQMDSDHRSMGNSSGPGQPMGDEEGNFPTHKRSWQEGPGMDRGNFHLEREFTPPRDDPGYGDFSPPKHMGPKRGGMHRDRGGFQGPRGSRGSFRGGSRSRRGSFRGNARGGGRGKLGGF